MFRFQHQEYFIFLLLAGVAIVAFLAYNLWRKKKMHLFGKENLVRDLMPSYSGLLLTVKFVLLVAALLIGVLGLANLQKRGKVERIAQQGIDIMIALDVSNSMYAQDLRPSRLEKAKLFTNKLMDQLSGNRMGLVLFAGRSYLSVPLTTDIEALKMNLSVATPETVPTQGTVMGDALQMSFEAFNTKDAKHKAIVLISDGEDHEDKAIAEAKKIGQKGIMLCTVGVGSDAGSNILLPNGDVKKDRQGQEVISKMNEKELKKIASSGQGVYVNLSNIKKDVDQISNRLSQISKTNLGESRLANYSSYFQYFIGLMLLLLLVEFFLPSKKPNRRLRTAFHVILLLIVPQLAFSQTQDRNIYSGNKYYKNNQYDLAAGEYLKAINGKNARAKEPALFNMGNALFNSNKSEEALKQYERVGLQSKDKQMSAAAYHNAGNVKSKEKKWQEAINYYKAALKKNPQAQDTKYNLAYAQKKLKQQQNQQNKNKDKQKNKDQEKDKKPNEPNKDQQEQKEKDQEKKDEDKQNEQNKPQPQPSSLTKQQAKKLLDALSREEKKVKDKKDKGRARGVILDKDW